MNIAKINPYIRVAIPSILKSGIMRRIIYDYELIYIERGYFTFMYNEEIYPCKSGDFIFICPGVPHSFQIDFGEISQPHIHFDITHRFNSEEIPVSFKDKSDMNDRELSLIHKNYFLDKQKSPVLNINNKSKFAKCFFDVIECPERNSLVAKARVIELLSTIINDNFPCVFEEHVGFSVENQVKDFIDAGHGFNMRLDDFSKQFSYSKFHLERKFKESFGMGIIEYRNIKRMDAAQRLVDEISITEAAAELGFGSIYSFSKAFKAYFGHSPTKKE